MLTQRAFITPMRPVVLRKGEKAKERRVGACVLLIIEQIPKTAPRKAPAAGPRTMDPMITGMWTVVALMIGSWIMPSGVFASRITIAAIKARVTM
jgi:hypothetical protein